jgi:hypothetical protein
MPDNKIKIYRSKSLPIKINSMDVLKSTKKPVNNISEDSTIKNNKFINAINLFTPISKKNNKLKNNKLQYNNHILELYNQCLKYK